MMVSWPIYVVLLATMVSDPEIATVAGTGIAGDSGDGGLAVTARLDQPFDVAFDRQGNVFLTDTFNHRIRRIDGATGKIATVADTNNHRIRRVSSAR
jgi:streptogramin lyase